MLFAAAGLASCAAPSGSLSDAGKAETGAAETGDAPTFVSLNPCLDAILVDVAAPDQILALSHYSRDASSSSIDPQVAAQFAVTGGTAEEVLALQPDIVLASTFIAPATRAALERAGLTVETFGSPASVDESVAQIAALAALADRDAEGAALVQRITETLPSAKAPLGHGAARTLLWQPGQIVPGEASLVWDILSREGLENYGAALGLSQADHVSLEMIVANPPDLLLIAGKDAGQTHPLLGRLDKTYVARFEPNLFYCGGPSILKAWERLEEIRADFMSNPPGSGVHDAR